MQTNFFSKFKHVLSDERLSAYQQRLARDGNRNLFSHHARQQFRRADWFDDANIIHARGKASIDKAKVTLQRKKKPLDPGRIIAELNFSFWPSLPDKRYEKIL